MNIHIFFTILFSVIYTACSVLAAPCPDFNSDGHVGDSDVAVFNAAYGSNCNEGYSPRCDFDMDGDVDGGDTAVFGADYGRTDCKNCTNDCEGDFDCDGDVDGNDLSFWGSCGGHVCGNPSYNAKCDFDYDGDIDSYDQAYFMQFNRTDVDANCSIICNYNMACDINETYQTCPSDCFKPIQPSCGATITENSILTADLLNCPYGGLKIYQENITLDCNGHKITGKGAEIGMGTGINTNAASTIKNCLISGFENGILLSGSAKSIVENNTLQENRHGIYIFTGYDIIMNNKIINNKKDSQGVAGDGITNDEGSYITIENNVISNNEGWGINLDGHVGHEVSGNVISSNSDGAISASPVRKSLFSNNIISDSKFGIIFKAYFSGYNSDCSYFRCSGTKGICMANENILTNNKINNVAYPLIIKGDKCRNSPYCGDEPAGCSNISVEFCDYNECYNNNIDTTNTVNGKPMYYLYKKSDQVYENLDAGYFACMECDNVTIKNVKTESNYFGFFFYNNSNLKLDNIRSRNNRYGIYFAHSANTYFTNSVIDNSTLFDVYNVDMKQFASDNTTCGLGMCYDPEHKICPCTKKSPYYVKISDSGCPDFDGNGNVDSADDTLFKNAYPSQCNNNYNPRCDFDYDGNIGGSDLSVFGADYGRTDCKNCTNDCEGDFDCDGDVDDNDMSIFGKAYGSICNQNFNPSADMDNNSQVNEADMERFVAYSGESVYCYVFIRVDKNNNKSIEIEELMELISHWKVNSSDVTIKGLILGIGLWKRGTP